MIQQYNNPFVNILCVMLTLLIQLNLKRFTVIVLYLLLCLNRILFPNEKEGY